MTLHQAIIELIAEVEKIKNTVKANNNLSMALNGVTNRLIAVKSNIKRIHKQLDSIRNFIRVIEAEEE